MVNATPRELSPGKETWHPFYRRPGEPQGQSGRVRKISLLPGFDPRTVQPVGSRYTDYATLPLMLDYILYTSFAKESIANFDTTYYSVPEVLIFFCTAQC